MEDKRADWAGVLSTWMLLLWTPAPEDKDLHTTLGTLCECERRPTRTQYVTRGCLRWCLTAHPSLVAATSLAACPSKQKPSTPAQTREHGACSDPW